MAKDLPYFKFHAAEWINGNITLEEIYTQGIFINACSYYWFRSGSLTIEELKRRLPKIKPTAFQSLIKNGIIEVIDGNIKIKFLDEQLAERDQTSRINSMNGALGGRPKKATALFSESETKPKQKPLREEKKREEKSERREHGITHEHFIIVKGKYLQEQSVRINGKSGLIEYMVENQTVLNLPEHAEKFMRHNKGKVYNELSHVQNAYSKYVENQFK